MISHAALPAVLLLAVVSAVPVRSANALPKVTVSECGLVGTIGTHRVRMMLSYYEENRLSGSYYVATDMPFARNWATDINVAGTVAADGSFRMEESAGGSFVRSDDEDAADDEPEKGAEDPFDELGVMTGTMTLDGPASRPALRLTGTWSLPDGTNSLALSLAEVQLPRTMKIRTKTFARTDRRVRTRARATYPSLVGRPAFERQMLRTVRLSASELHTNADQPFEGADPDDYSTLDMDYEITYATPAYVSVVFRAHAWYTGFITHDRLELWGETFDTRRGRAVTLRDLFGPSYKRELAPKVRAALAGTYWTADVAGTPKDIARADFYLVDGGVMLTFGVDHSLGGVVEVFIPKTL